MAFNKKVLIYGASSAALVLALVVSGLGVKSCNDKNSQRDAEINKELAAATKNLDKASASLKKAIETISSQESKIQQQSDSIVVLNDSIKVLNDSLEVVNWKLGECEKEKKVVRPVENKKRTQPKPVVEEKKEEVVRNNKSTIKVGENVSNTGVINIENQKNNNASNTSSIELGDGAVNEGAIIINNGDVINNYHKDEKVDTISSSSGKYKIILYNRTITRKTYSR